MIFALVGNQNSGKTTLFNKLTGSSQHVGNWPGVTVEKKEGKIKRHKDIRVVDLPGIYSLSPYSTEEIVSRNFVLENTTDAVINIVDATSLERSLYLTLQLMELGKPMVIALNMMDDVDSRGDRIDVNKLSDKLGIPIVPISARRNRGIDKLISTAIDVGKNKRVPKLIDICEGVLHESLHSVSALLESRATACGYTPRFAASKLIEGDEPVLKALSLSTHELHIVDEILEEMEHRSGQERDSMLADQRFKFITKLVSETVNRKKPEGAATVSDKIDRILTNRILAIPIFLGIMYGIFWLTFGPLGTFISDNFAALIDMGIGAVDEWLVGLGVAEWLHGLIVGGILTGVGSVLGFLPLILLLFLFISILEDTGYMARAAFVMDRLLRKIGLSGRSFIPMIMGFGCSVPAIMATRTLENERDRKMTILVTPFMSCTARVPIYGVFVAAFFAQYQAITLLSIYVLGIVVAVLSALLLSKTVFKGQSVPFLMELPTYRLPSLRNVLMQMWDKGKGFIQRAFTIIFAATVVIWFLSSFNFSMQMVDDNSQSMLATIGGFIAPIFAPLGFGTWESATSVVTGILAKENVVGTMAILYNVGEEGVENGALSGLLSGAFTPLAAYAMMAFTLLYVPCAAAFAAMRRELGSMKLALAGIAYQTGVAWIVAFLIFNIGGLFVR